MNCKIVSIAALATALLGATSIVPALAVPVTFFGQDLNGPPNNDPNALASHPVSDTARNTFFLNLSGVGTETFDTAATPTGTHNPSLAFPGAGTATLTGSGSVATGNDGAGRYPISGARYYNAGTGNFGVTFSAPIAAFGFYGVDIGDYGGQLTLTLTDTAAGTTVLTVPNFVGTSGNVSGSILYYGFYDLTKQYTSIAFANNSGGSDVFAFDNMSVGSLQQVTPQVPEPASMLLFGTGLIAFGWSRRRKA
jgi:hypothetical protein